MKIRRGGKQKNARVVLSREMEEIRNETRTNQALARVGGDRECAALYIKASQPPS